MTDAGRIREKKSNKVGILREGFKARMALHLLGLWSECRRRLCTDRNERVKLERKPIQKIFSFDAGFVGPQAESEH